MQPWSLSRTQSSGLQHDDVNSRVPMLHQVYQAASEVASPVASGIVIICLVFLPLLSLQGLEGKLFAPVALTIIFALGASLVLSLTLIPVLSSYLLKRGQHGDPLLMRLLSGGYRVLLKGSLAFPLPVYLLAAVGMGALVYAYGSIGKAFMPTMDEGSMIMQITKLPSINLKSSIEGDLIIQRALKAKRSRKSSGSSRASVPTNWASIRWVQTKPIRSLS